MIQRGRRVEVRGRRLSEEEGRREEVDGGERTEEMEWRKNVNMRIEEGEEDEDESILGIRKKKWVRERNVGKGVLEFGYI